MDFTNLTSFSHTSEPPKTKANKQILSTFQDYSVDPIHTQYQNILTHIKQINYNRSFNKTFIQSQIHPNQHNYNHYHQNQLIQNHQIQYNFSPKQIKHINFTKSNIFNYIKTQKQQQKSNLNNVKIYYFNQPIHKIIQFSLKTTVLGLIKIAIDEYLQDQQFQKSFASSHRPQDYQLRLPQNQNTHLPDIKLCPLQQNRIISQNMFQTLVIVQKQKNNKSLFENKINQNLINQNKIHISLYNEIQQKIGVINLSYSQSVSSIYSFIKSNFTHIKQFILTQNNNLQIPQDFQIKDLTSHKLYVKNKRYADQSQQKQIIHVTQVKSCVKKPTQNIIPINLTQASMYQQFQLIKVNQRGIKQQRILGIDQMKIYNYETQTRKQKRQISLMSIIFGNNQNTGTKTPYRLIKDIQNIIQTNQGFRIKYKQKTITYLIQNQIKKQRIIQKLKYLISYHQS